jgi:hypothetical protein
MLAGYYAFLEFSVMGNEIKLLFYLLFTNVQLFINMKLITKKSYNRYYDNSRILQHRSKKF